MKKNILLLTMCLLTLGVAAQQATNIRYVSATNGLYENDGKSWEKPKKNVQDAINSLLESGQTGEVWVAAGTYKPTESTEKVGGSTLYMSIKIPAGITVRGGFLGKATVPDLSGKTDPDGNALELKSGGTAYATGADYPGETSADERLIVGNSRTIGTQNVKQDWEYFFKTKLTGDLSQAAVFKWNKTKNYWDASFYGNCYHVVWFATNGFDDNGRANALPEDKEACVEGVTIMNGNAQNNELNGRPHNAYGGGVYMVEGSRVENCRIVNCEASRDGGGIYMDGGGIVKHCYVENCQTLGIGVQNGYGGGVCLDANDRAKSRYGIYRSAITGCVGRLGGGLAIKCQNIESAPSAENFPAYYLPFASAVLVANNTATTEAGGIYTIGGGAMSNMTVVNNECNGTGVVSNNMATGRAGGIYCRDRTLIMNTVMWGNGCENNGDVQYAATMSENTDANRVQMKYCALSLSDKVDWSATTSSNVFNLSIYNDPAAYKTATGSDASDREVFPNFYQPSAEPGWYAGEKKANASNPPKYEDYENPVDAGILNSSCWMPGPNSGLANAGIVSHDLNTDNKTPFVSQPSDILDRQFTAFSTLGAYIREFSRMTPYDGTIDGMAGYHFFVDPNAPTNQTSVEHGKSWKVPARFLNNVLYTVSHNTTYASKTVYIHVKEGTMTPVNSYRAESIRNISFHIPSNVQLLGGYPEELGDGATAEDSEEARELKNDTKGLERNPLLHPTILSGSITDNYEMNTRHLVTIKDADDTKLSENIVIDGFQIRYGNARSTEGNTRGNDLNATSPDGAGIVADMVNNVQFRNLTVAGCTAQQGAAVYLRNAANTSFENCIFHNNDARNGVTPQGIVFTDCTTDFHSTYNTAADPTFKHCNVLNNVGHAVMLAGASFQNWENSIFFANWSDNKVESATKTYNECYTNDIENQDFLEIINNATNSQYVIPSYAIQTGSTGQFHATRCLFDLATTFAEEWTYYYKNKGDASNPATTPETWLSYKLDDANYPRFVNSVKSVGVTQGGDVTFYGRATSFEPNNNNPMVNAAYTAETDHTKWGTDISTVTTRDYGGAPDIGAVENHNSTTAEAGENAYPSGQPAYGAAVYVRDYGTDLSIEGRDGTSWSKAINGNADYSADITNNNQTSVTYAYELSTIDDNSVSTSTTERLKIFKIGMQNGENTPNGTIYYARNTSDNMMFPTTTRDDGDNFILLSTDITGVYKIYNKTKELYVRFKQTTQGAQTVELTQNADNNTTWQIESKNSATDFKTYVIKPYRNGTAYDVSWNYYYGYNGNNPIGLYGDLDNDETSHWQFYLVTATQKGLQYAIQIANENYTKNFNANPSTAKSSSVYVGAGTYNGNFYLRDGASIYGGFPASGNPGENERNISNNNDDYKTFIDAKGSGRVLTQNADFTTPTTVEGFIIQNGVLSGGDTGNGGAGVKLLSNGILKNCIVTKNTMTVNDFYKGPTNNQYDGVGGGGIYIGSGGLVKNCIIRDNSLKTTNEDLPTSNGYHIRSGGAGVYSDGGTFQNSLIVENTATAENSNGKSYILGAGLYIGSTSNLYNCTVAYNVADNGTATAATGGVWDNGATANKVKKNSLNATELAELIKLWPRIADKSNNDDIVTSYSNTSKYYNCIFWGNYAKGSTLENFFQIGMTGFGNGAGYDPNNMYTCYHSAANNTYASDIITEYTVYSWKGTGSLSVSDYTNFENACRDNSPFKGDQRGIAKGVLTYELKEPTNGSKSLYCINNGSQETILKQKNIYEDIQGEDRVQDCTVDKGAYEYNNFYGIAPHTYTVTTTEGSNTVTTNMAVFYVTPEGGLIENKANGTSEWHKGNASANSPVNAACAAKLQRVLDAAGRYKYLNKDYKVIVKVANSNSQHSAGTDFQYYATRSTDAADADVRIWSIMVPRGVEVWGGYTDTYTSDTKNGFYERTGDNENNYVYDDTGIRSITKNPTVFDSYYYSNSLNSGIYTYHVLTFTDKIFDGDGYPYLDTDATKLANNQSSSYNKDATGQKYLSLKSKVEARAVVDGIHITGGQADVQASGVSGNINRYGGGAIVTDYAHVRNCIVRDNKGVYGGALALTHGALVTGCLIDQNTADQGGAIYVFPHGTDLSDGTKIDTEVQKGENLSIDDKMPRVISTTIVNNKANVQGGGVWFSDNVRFNSVVIWQNESQDQANVRGTYLVSRPDGSEYANTEHYPFNFSAVQDITPSGINNISAAAENKGGVRFRHVNYNPNDETKVLAVEDKNATGFDRFSQFGYYVPSTISTLTRGGMPLNGYTELNKDGELSATDFMGVSRTIMSDNSTDNRRFIEIGALANNTPRPDGQMMLRLYVAKPEDIDTDAQVDLVLNGQTSTDPTADLYAQQGSSFANPFTRLQDALDYVYEKRGIVINADGEEEFDASKIIDNANNLAFEIFLGPGTYKPSVDITGYNGNVVGNTFLIPEGVSLMGGLDPRFACDASGAKLTNSGNTKHILGQYATAKYYNPETEYNNVNVGKEAYAAGKYYITNNITLPTNTSSTITIGTKEYAIQHVNKDQVNKNRELADVNANSVVEPWELKNQTILSGEIDDKEHNGVNHIVTIIANEDYTGALPSTQGSETTMYPNHESEVEGYHPHEHGQIIAFDGITFKGGYAYNYQKETVNDAHKMNYNHGGAILVDGNQYKNTKGYGSVNKDETTGAYKHAGYVSSVGFREIPVMANRCKFVNNQAGYGGAISSNGTLEVLNSSMEQNRAMAGTDQVDWTSGTSEPTTLELKYPGAGGAIYGTYQVNAINTIFENNEAVSEGFNGTFIGNDYTILSDMTNSLATGKQHSTFKLIGGCGGAVFVARKAHFHFLNCNFVKNQANAYPAIFTMNPNYYAQSLKANMTLKDYNQAINCVFWGNDVNSEVKGKATDEQLKVVSKVVNYGRADRGGNAAGATINAYTLGENGVDIDNLGTSSTNGYIAKNQTELDVEATSGTVTGFTETIWFSAYEEGRGKTPKNTLDLRDMTFHPRQHIKSWIISELGTEKFTKLYGYNATTNPNGYKDAVAAYQNCNIKLASENTVNEGPNFVNPSDNAGYDGYMESADWSPARLNNLTDNGWGKIQQTVSSDNAHTATFNTYASDADVPTEPDGRKDNGTTEGYSSEGAGDYIGNGAYHALRYLQGNEKYQKTMPIGNDEYMYATYVDKEGKTVNFHRISKDPNPTQNQTYVDMGVYEYNHTQLQYHTEDGVDILWVSPREKSDNGLPDGSDWSQPTSDLQRAIETLLASRNGNRKEIRLMDGTFTPIYTIGDGKNLAFYINTLDLNSATMLDENEENPSTLKTGEGVKSLTFKGGYSYELENIRDVNDYPAVIRQQERNGTGNKWDYLFYIADPTQRYGYEQYNNSNGNGHISGTDNNMHTIPIEFDGITIVNDQANENTQGAAIYYADLSGMLKTAQALTDTNGNKIYNDNQKDITSTPANVSITKTDGTHDFAVVDNPPKITISKSQIMASGTKGKTTSSAVYIGNHGSALLFNNVLHSNYGQPLVTSCLTNTVNNTYALNGGTTDLRVAGSTIHNSVFWRNNKTAETPTFGKQFRLQGFNTEFTPQTDATTGVQTWVDTEKADDYTNTAGILSYNAYTGGPTEKTDYNEPSGTVAGFNYNTKLDDSNEDFINGPNFVSPGVNATAQADIEARNFMLMPSLHLMNKGKDAHYTFVTEKDADGKANGNPTIYDFAYNTTYDEDAATNERMVGTIDIGAYELQSKLNRVLYVDPLKSENNSTEAGINWETPFGIKQIQNAIDLAALYHTSAPDECAFVFVKGFPQQQDGYPSDNHTDEDVILRNGVLIFGGIPSSFGQKCAKYEVTYKDGEGKEHFESIYRDSDILTFMQTISGSNEGYVGPNTNITPVYSIRTGENETYTRFKAVQDTYSYHKADGTLVTGNTRIPVRAQIAGFYVTNPGKTITEPVININPNVAYTTEEDTEAEKAAARQQAQVVLRQIVVRDNIYDASVTENKDVAVMKNSLVYGSLFHSNTPAGSGAVLRLDEGAYAVNITAQGKTVTKVGGTDKTPYNGHGKLDDDKDDKKLETEKDNRIIFSIVNYDGQDGDFPQTEGKNATTDQTKYTLTGHNYRRKNEDLYFQLAEGSKHINEITIAPTQTNPTAGIFPDKTFQKTINYNTDRDMLGNPRVLTLDGSSDKKLDRGAFETWKVEVDTQTDHGKNANGYSKHFAPHAGSVVYIMEGATLDLTKHTEPNHEYSFKPGFLLLKDGASLYSNGVTVNASYVAVERRIPKEGAVVSMPFDMEYIAKTGGNMSTDDNWGDGLTRSYYEEENGTFNAFGNKGILHLDYDIIDNGDRGTESGTKFYEYNGNKRMERGYQFKEDLSSSWTKLTGSTIKVPANQGILIVPSTSLFGGTDGTEYESNVSNLGGQSVYEKDKEAGIIYRFTAKSDGFSKPVYWENLDLKNNIPLDEPSKSVTLTQHDDHTSTDGGADFTSEEDMGWNCIGLPYLVSNYQTHGVGNDSYADKAGVNETDYNMHIPHTMWLYYNGTYRNGTTDANGSAGYYSVDSWDASNWNLPTSETAHIWLGEGIFMQTAAVNDTETLKFYRPVYHAPSGSQIQAKRNARYYVGEEIEELPETGITITAIGHTVHVKGLQGGETVSIFDPSGRLYLNETAPANTYSTRISAPGVYIVKVNAERKKVLIK